MLFVAGFCTLVLVSLTFYFYFSKMFIDIWRAIFNYTLDCWHCVASEIDGWMGMGHQWNDTARGRPKLSEKILSLCHFLHHKSYMHQPEIEARLS
jgi:hypothetical protein